MTVKSLGALLAEMPLVVSVQASESSPMDDVEALLRLAKASVFEGVRIIRLEGADRIPKIHKRTGAVVIGLVKRRYEDSEVYITPTLHEVQELIDSGCEVIALDATQRARPHGEQLASLVSLIHEKGLLAMADCDCVESAHHAIECGVDLLGTTLAGYTDQRLATPGPDLNLIRELVKLGKPVLGEGRFSERWEVEAALQIGAVGVVVGGRINDPVKSTRALIPSAAPTSEIVAFDLGGTWLRCARFNQDLGPTEVERIEMPSSRADRLAWMRKRAEGAAAIGISSGGTIDPRSGEVWESKPSIPDYQGTRFTFDAPTVALNDGLATAWGHACLPQFAGKRVATLALGTGVGAGFVAEGKLMMGPYGQYPRLNDLPLLDGRTVEQALGGLSLTSDPTSVGRDVAREAFRRSVELIQTMWFPDVLVVCGSVGLSDILVDECERLEVVPSPFGVDAGLMGAAALVRYPGWQH